jgi:bacillopeptidase F
VLPWALKVVLLTELLGLAGVAIVLGGDTLGRVTAAIGGSIGQAFGPLIPVGVRTAVTSATAVAVTIAAPRLDAPVSAYTQLPNVAVSGLLPGGVAGTGDVLKVYVGGTIAATEPVPPTIDFTVASVALAEGPNVITATISTPAGESEPSAPISITFDNIAPPLTLSSPRNGASVRTATVAVVGTTQAGSTVTIEDVATAGSTSVVASANGAFAATITLAKGSNALIVTAVDPAGNRTTKSLTVVRR